MRTILFFDLPMITKNDLSCYRRFLKSLKKDGFYMFQESIYVRMAIDQQSSLSIIKKVKDYAPSRGNIVVLTITEKQFNTMDIIAGDVTSEVLTSDERSIFI